MKAANFGYGVFLVFGSIVVVLVGTSLNARAMGPLEPVSGMEFGYDPPDVVPTNWERIAPLCGKGKEQSPIDLSQSKLAPREDRVKVRNLRDLKFSYHETPVVIVNDGHDVDVEYEPGSTLQLKKYGPLFEVRQIHFHSPSEHSFDQGALFEIEIHIVHSQLGDPSQLAVVALMVKEGQENVAIKPVFDQLVDVMNKGDHFVGDEEFNIADALPKDPRYFSNMGSLTTPPCTEQVRWHVLRHPIKMSRAQINELIAVIDNSCCKINRNNRPTQPLNDRNYRSRYPLY